MPVPVRSAVDAACAAAVEPARAAAEAEAGGAVGEHLGVEADDQRLATHLFDSAVPGYRGWRWAVTVTRASRSKAVTVDEVVLLPGPDALRPPEWLPWSERLQPGDLGVGDLLPTAPDDERLVPAYVQSTDSIVEEVATEIGLGRERVMSVVGRNDAADRWWSGETGPQTAMAAHAPAHCGGCGFYLPVAGALRAAFGVCGNEFAPSDGRVVATAFGCGAHSEALVEATPISARPDVVYDDATFELDPPDDGDSSEDADLGHS